MSGPTCLLQINLYQLCINYEPMYQPLCSYASNADYPGTFGFGLDRLNVVHLVLSTSGPTRLNDDSVDKFGMVFVGSSTASEQC